MSTKNLLSSIISQHLPTLIAQQILGVQPMPGSNIFTMDMDVRRGHSYPRLGNYSFSRSHWYIGETTSHYAEVYAWCEDKFGPHPKQPDAWSRWWRYSYREWYFRDEKDFVFFMLRWS